MPDRMRMILSDWTRLGIMFNVPPARRTPDIEPLLVRTAGSLGENPRLLPTVLTWLTRWESLVCRHRLARLVVDLEPRTLAAMGVLLDFARKQSHSSHLNVPLAACKPLRIPQPLFEVDRRSDVLAAQVHDRACRISRRWGLWTEQPSPVPDALRPIAWILADNPDLQWRAVFGGNLRASILACLQADPTSGHSELALADACGVTRKALREALDHLELCALVARTRHPSRTEITCCTSPSQAA